MMRLQFLETSAAGLDWMKAYYGEQVQLDAEGVFANFETSLEQLKQSPFSGRLFDGFENVRELQIIRSPFSILYTSKDDTIYIIDIRDSRGHRSAKALAVFNAKLRHKYGL